nr:MAG TPA: hypothetical protein [Bacteriophage sp.]
MVPTRLNNNVTKFHGICISCFIMFSKHLK